MPVWANGPAAAGHRALTSEYSACRIFPELTAEQQERVVEVVRRRPAPSRSRAPRSQRPHCGLSRLVRKPVQRKQF